MLECIGSEAYNFTLMENVSSKWLVKQIGGEQRLVKVVKALEEVCDFSNLAERVSKSNAQVTNPADLILGTSSNDDPLIQERWISFTKDASDSKRINHTSVDNFDDHVQIVFDDTRNWSALTLRSNGFDPGVILGRREGSPFIKPMLYMAEEDYVSVMPDLVLAGGLADTKRKHEDYWFERSITRILRDQFFEDPLGYLERYQNGLPIFENGLMTTDEFGEYLKLIESVASEKNSGYIPKWRRGDNYPEHLVGRILDASLGGLDNTEGYSLALLLREDGWTAYTTATPILVFDQSKLDIPVGSTLVKNYLLKYVHKEEVERAVSFGHISLDRYRSMVHDKNRQREARSRELLNIIV